MCYQKSHSCIFFFLPNMEIIEVCMSSRIWSLGNPILHNMCVTQDQSRHIVIRQLRSHFGNECSLSRLDSRNRIHDPRSCTTCVLCTKAQRDPPFPHIVTSKQVTNELSRALSSLSSACLPAQALTSRAIIEPNRVVY